MKYRVYKDRSQWYGTALSQALILGLGVISGIASARLLGPQGRGELAAITLWPTAFAFLASLGLNQSIVFYTGKKQYTVSEICTASGLIGFAQGLAVICIGAALMPLLLHKYSPETIRLGLLFLLAAPAMIFGGYPGNFFQGRRDLF